MNCQLIFNKSSENKDEDLLLHGTGTTKHTQVKLYIHGHVLQQSQKLTPNALDYLKVKWETMKASGESKTLGGFVQGDGF